ncbi:MAG: phosphotransferase [Candidatus Promineifilaceae bacterium]
MQELEGGRAGKIFRSADNVYRPAGFWSPSVHLLLAHLRAQQFMNAPEPVGFDESGNEIVSFVAGDVYNYPLRGAVASEEALCSAARLLRRYHDASATFLEKDAHKDLSWLLPAKEPQEVICHSDYAPYNVVLEGNCVVGMFDFDGAHPAPRLWDIAYAVYCWTPFKTNPDDALGDLAQQSARAKLFCDSYGLPQQDRHQLAEKMATRIEALVAFMHDEARKGNAAFIANIADGHDKSYLNDIAYLRRHADTITLQLIAD